MEAFPRTAHASGRHCSAPTHVRPEAPPTRGLKHRATLSALFKGSFVGKVLELIAANARERDNPNKRVVIP
jgi:DNA-binding sugar fermentation-stimulating protein